jgi:hypothetical protein
MDKQMHDTERHAVTVWTPWGEQRVGGEDSRHARLRKRLETCQQASLVTNEIEDWGKPDN